jgi:hypothetical protein
VLFRETIGSVLQAASNSRRQFGVYREMGALLRDTATPMQRWFSTACGMITRNSMNSRCFAPTRGCV